ncbi:hypothetical protein Tco_1292757 [Tanacetum coccineum]
MSHQPIRAYGIAKVELAVCDVGLRDSDGVLFVEAGVEVKGMDEQHASCVREVTNVITTVQIECSPSCMIKAIDFLSLFLDEWDD